jgi:hypothetical protein
VIAVLEAISAASLTTLAKFTLIAAFVLWLARLQKRPDVDLFQFVQDPVTGKFNGFRLAYVVALWATTYKFIVTPMSGSDLAVVMAAYGTLWVVGSTAAKYIDRPPDPPPVPVPAVPAAPIVQNINQPGGNPG